MDPNQIHLDIKHCSIKRTSIQFQLKKMKKKNMLWFGT